MITALWQPLGSSTHLLAQQFGLHVAEPATHTGTLDPMASGVVVVLTGEDRFAKGNLAFDKTYAFSILWGTSTDSLDQLGLVTAQTVITHSSLTSLDLILKQQVRTYAQRIPDYSARRIAGRSSFDHAKSSLPVPAKFRTVTIHSLTHERTEEILTSNVLTEHTTNVRRVQGDFRQQQCIASWRQQLTALGDRLIVTHHTATVSTGTYIRQLVADIAASVGVPATTWSITRTRNGPFGREDCIQIEQLQATTVPTDS